MNKYKVNGAVFRIAAVELGLTKDQAEPRKRSLTKTGEDTYRVNETVEFKSGEIIRIAPDDIPKNFVAFLDLLEESPEAAKVKKTKAKAAADKQAAAEEEAARKAAEEEAARKAAGGQG